MDVVAHADFVAVIDDGRARHRQQQAVHQFDAAAVAFQQRREPPADAEIEARAPVGGVGLPQIVALAVGHHFERQLVVVAQEDRPLAVLRDRRRLAHDVADREAILARDRHVHARHQREMERHVAFVAVAEIILGILRPLVGFGEQHPAGKRRIELGANPLEHLRGSREGSRCWCLRARRDTARRRAAGRRRRAPARSASRSDTALSTCGLSKFRSG